MYLTLDTIERGYFPDIFRKYTYYSDDKVLVVYCKNDEDYLSLINYWNSVSFPAKKPRYIPILDSEEISLEEIYKDQNFSLKRHNRVVSKEIEYFQ